MASIPNLNMVTNLDRFFSKLTTGDIFTYSDAYIFDEVKKMADRRGKNIQYCGISLPEYKAYGCFCAKVISDAMNHTPQIFHFDPKYLDI